MTATGEVHDSYKLITTINLDNPEQYQKFIKDIAQCILAEFSFDDELDKDIAYELVHDPNNLSDLAEAIINKLLERIAEKCR